MPRVGGQEKIKWKCLFITWSGLIDCYRRNRPKDQVTVALFVLSPCQPFIVVTFPSYHKHKILLRHLGKTCKVTKWSQNQVLMCTTSLGFGRKILGYSVLYNQGWKSSDNYLISDFFPTPRTIPEISVFCQIIVRLWDICPLILHHCVVTGLHSSSALRFCAQNLLIVDVIGFRAYGMLYLYNYIYFSL